MRVPFRVSLYAGAIALLALIAFLATLQYHWLGQISDAERERMKATVTARTAAFAQDVDRELTRAYLTFQFDPMQGLEGTAARTAARYDRWQATAKYPKLLEDVYLVTADDEPRLQHFNPATRVVEPVGWPAALEPLRAQLSLARPVPVRGTNTIFKALPPAEIEDIPALVVPTPVLVMHDGPNASLASQLSCTVLLLDRSYLEHELLPALARQHFRGTGDGIDYRLAVVRPASNTVVYHSAPDFSPNAATAVDASSDLFRVRVQDFGELVSEVRRLSTFLAAVPHPPGGADRRGGASTQRRAIVRETFTMPMASGGMTFQPSSPMSIVVEQSGVMAPDKLIGAASAARLARSSPAQWRLMVKHPSGSLEQAVGAARRRNLLVSSSVLAVLGVSVGFLIVSTRRAHALARQQMEFVATVSHELRTPLAVIRSAADNLADGVVTDEGHVKRYGVLVRDEGRRLSELVEQVLEYAGLQSGARTSRVQPIALDPLLRDVVAGARAAAVDAGVAIELAIPDALPAVSGDEPALRRVFQNFLGNAVKYGAQGRWVGIRANVDGASIDVAVSDRGMGISLADQGRIFDPFYRAQDVVTAQIQGAGLGLSLVKRIVDAHGGRIAVTSTVGAGSTFTVTLPVAGGAPAESATGVGATATQHS